MGRKRKGDGYNEGKYKEVEYFLKGLKFYRTNFSVTKALSFESRNTVLEPYMISIHLPVCLSYLSIHSFVKLYPPIYRKSENYQR